MTDPDAEPQDSERYPGLSAQAAQLLQRMREHPHAPIYRNRSGHRLLPAEVAQLQAWSTQVQAASVDPRPQLQSGWLEQFVAHALRCVPAYRRYGSMPGQLSDLPCIHRGDLARDIAAFFPDDVPIERLINFRTTGLTGQPLLIASHPLVAGRYLALHERALARFGVRLRCGAGDVGVMLVGWQQRCFTYVSVTPQRGEAGLAKINLHTDDWRDAADRAPYIDALAPEIITGDPLSLAVLLDLPLQHRPRALLSTSMSLSSGLRQALESRFGCPVLDVYSLNEAGPIAVYDPALDAHVLLQSQMAVEVVDDDGFPLAEGARGEITLSGGFNHCLPLLRYRTGDHGALECRDGEWVIAGLAGRAPVRFRTSSGEWINNIDVTHRLKPFALAQYALAQDAHAAFEFNVYGRPGASAVQLEQALRALLGENCTLRINAHDQPCDKVVQYWSELDARGGR